MNLWKNAVNYGAKRICLPHFGLIPEDFNNEYWQMFEDECMEKIRLVKDMKEKGFTQEEMLEKFKERMLETCHGKRTAYRSIF